MTMPLKLLIVGQLPPPYHGSNVMTKIFMVSLQKMGFEVSIAEKTFSMRLDEVERYSIKKLMRALVVTINLVRIFVSARTDLCFYFISIKPPTIYLDIMFLLLLRLKRMNIVLYIHGKGFRKFCKSSLLMRRLLKSPIISNSLGAIVLGERLKKDIDFFIPNDRLFVLPNCVPDIDSRVLCTQSTKVNCDKINILYLSNLMPDKGPIEFLKMAREVVDSGEPVKFILAGATTSESFQQEIDRIISDLKLKDNVETVGGVYGSEKERLFHESDIFVFPTHHEAFGLVNIEAMRAGIPVISSNEGCIPEVVIDGLNGYVVNPLNILQLSDRVLRLVCDEELRIKMGKAGRKIYEEYFTVEVYERKLEDAMRFFLKLRCL